MSRPDPTDAVRAVLDVLRGEWEARLVPEVERKVSDAHAHALKALTGVLKSAPDGKASILQVNRSPSFRAAVSRLDELWAWLAGPSETSLAGKVRDAREEFYRASCRGLFPMIPEDIRSRSSHAPNEMEVRVIRAAVIHGYDPRKVLEGPVTTAKRALKASLEQAGRKSTPGRVEDDILEAWESRTASAINTTVRTLLSDSAFYAFRRAGVNLIDPEFLEETA